MSAESRSQVAEIDRLARLAAQAIELEPGGAPDVEPVEDAAGEQDEAHPQVDPVAWPSRARAGGGAPSSGTSRDTLLGSRPTRRASSLTPSGPPAAAIASRIWQAWTTEPMGLNPARDCWRSGNIAAHRTARRP